MLLGFLVHGMRPAEAAVLLEFQLVRCVLLVLRRCVIALLALGASESHNVPHDVLSPSTCPGKPDKGCFSLLVTITR